MQIMKYQISLVGEPRRKMLQVRTSAVVLKSADDGIDDIYC